MKQMLPPPGLGQQYPQDVSVAIVRQVESVLAAIDGAGELLLVVGQVGVGVDGGSLGAGADVRASLDGTFDALFLVGVAVGRRKEIEARHVRMRGAAKETMHESLTACAGAILACPGMPSNSPSRHTCGVGGR